MEDVSRQTEGLLRNGSEAPLVMWPDSLIRPAAPSHLAYLDLNHWISLAKYQTGHRDGARHQRLFEACLAAGTEKRVLFVLTDSLFAEISNIKDPRQRRDIAHVVGTLTRFDYLLGRPDVMRHEIQYALNILTGQYRTNFAPINLVNRGVLHAFGRVSGLSIQDPSGHDITHRLRQEQGKAQFDPWLRDLELIAEKMLLAGPADDEIPDLVAAGYAPEVARATTERRAEQEREQVSRFNASEKNWRRGRIRDVIAAREAGFELIDLFVDEFAARGIDLEKATGGTLQGVRSLMLGMPSTAVSIELKTRYHQDGNKKWSVNDIHDMDALSVAVPYCDVVFTDAAARNALVAAHIDRRMGTVLPRTPREMIEILNSCSGPVGT